MGSEQREDVSDTNSLEVKLVDFEETRANLKNRVKFNMAFNFKV